MPKPIEFGELIRETPYMARAVRLIEQERCMEKSELGLVDVHADDAHSWFISRKHEYENAPRASASKSRPTFPA